MTPQVGREMELIADLAYTRLYAETLRKMTAESDFRPGVVGYAEHMAELAVKAKDRIRQLVATASAAELQLPQALSNQEKASEGMNIITKATFDVASSEVVRIVADALMRRLGIPVFPADLRPVNHEGIELNNPDFIGFRFSVDADKLPQLPQS